MRFPHNDQGVITLSKMIITAASLYENLAATQTEAYSSYRRYFPRVQSFS
ncbi:MAG: hypothetical protein ACFFG0_31915 [Candidatus Thorarchaeota archaeon]